MITVEDWMKAIEPEWEGEELERVFREGVR